MYCALPELVAKFWLEFEGFHSEPDLPSRFPPNMNRESGPSVHLVRRFFYLPLLLMEDVLAT
jgi:hypothetical protein